MLILYLLAVTMSRTVGITIYNKSSIHDISRYFLMGSCNLNFIVNLKFIVFIVI